MKSQKRRTLNFDLFPLFIEVGKLWKISWMIRYELERILISKKLKKIGFVSIKESPGWATNLCQSALGECQVHIWVLVQFKLLFWGFLSWELYLDAFLICILKVNPLFLDFRSLSDNYLIDEYSKKSWLSTTSLLFDYPLYSHASKSIWHWPTTNHKIIN